MTIETKELYDKLEAMSEEERIQILDPICNAVEGTAKPYDGIGIYVLPNRIFALAVIDLYKQWQIEIYERD